MRSLADGAGVLRKRVTERLPGRSSLVAANRRLKAVVENSFDIVTLLDRQGRILHKSPTENRILGYDSASIVGRTLFDIVHDDDLDVVVEYFKSVVTSPFQNTSTVEMRLLRADGAWIWTEALFTNKLYDMNVGAIVLNSRDISEAKEIAEKMVKLQEIEKSRTQQDPLTGLVNHREFHRLFDRAIGKAYDLGQPLTLLLLDLSNFTLINDVYGHITGDEILKIVAKELQYHKGFVRCGVLPEDLIVGRYGGDEFAVLLPDVDIEAAINLPQMLENSFRMISFHPPGEETRVPLVCSIGAAVYPHDGLNKMSVLGAASERLKRTKFHQPDNEHADRVRRRTRETKEGFTLLDALLTAVDNKDRYTRRHSEDVMVYCIQIAEELRLDSHLKQTLEVAALLHDVGKIGIPDQILRKPGKLTDSEFAAIKQHPTVGAVMVSAVPGFENTLDAIRYHHERWDGNGYPSRKAGKDIPFLARIVATADAFSAMTTDRPYRSGMDESAALKIIEKGAGTQWDPACAAALIAARQRYNSEIRTSVEPLEYYLPEISSEAA